MKIANDVEDYEIPAMEVPDDDIRYCLGFLQPILESTVTKLYELNKPGWAGYLRVVYEMINDVMTAAESSNEDI